MFFGLSCQFKTTMDEFDKQDGLRKLQCHRGSPHPDAGDEYHLNDDEECAARQLAEVLSDQIRTIQGLFPMKARWTPVDEFLDQGGVNLLFAYHRIGLRVEL